MSELALPGKNNFESKGEAKQSSFASLLGNVAGLGSQEETCVDIITFVESEWGLGMGTTPGVPPLLPAQKFILKTFYGMELNNTDKTIPVFDKFNEHQLYNFTEVEFLDYLYEEGRINTKDFRGQHSTLELVCGRRGTKTSITSFVVNYELYRILLQYHPQAYFGIMPDDIISFTCLSTSESVAKTLYDRIVGNMERSPFFKDYLLKSPNSTEVFFRSRRDADKYGKNSKRYCINLVADACSARSQRGFNNVFVALDEVAHFFKDMPGKTSSDKSDKAIYDAVTPSLAMFKHPDGSPAGKIVLISSPAGRDGLLYEEYERSFDKEKGADVYMIQLPSWEMNPLIPSNFLKSKYYQSPLVFSTEFGSEFSDRLSGWIDDAEILYGCVDPTLKMSDRSPVRTPHFMGIDVGLKKDGTSVAIVHIEDQLIDGTMSPVIVLDYCEVRYASKEKGKDDGEPYFKPEEIVEWLVSFTKKFNIARGLMDQYYSMAIMPLLKAQNVHNLEARHFTDAINSEVYNNAMAKFMIRGVKLPGSHKFDEKGNEIDSELVTELLKLQAVQKSKYTLKVFAPEGKDSHDDLSDAYVRAIKIATEYLEGGGSHKVIPTTSKGKGLARRSASQAMRRMELNRPTRGMIYKSSMNGRRYGGR